MQSRAGRNVKKSVLELGGSDPFLVLEDANLEQAVAGALASRFVNSGQSCLAAKRVIVHENHRDEFVDGLAEAVRGLVVDDPLDTATQVGPLAQEDLVATLANQVHASVDLGARALVGGERLDHAGAWYAPTLLMDPPPGSRHSVRKPSVLWPPW